MEVRKRRRPWSVALCVVLLAVTHESVAQVASPRPRARELGVAPGIFHPGARNAITDVPGVTVGQVTVVEGDSVRTGVTVIHPHPGDVYRERVPAALHVGNGFGKLIGGRTSKMLRKKMKRKSVVR